MNNRSGKTDFIYIVLLLTLHSFSKKYWWYTSTAFFSKTLFIIRFVLLYALLITYTFSISWLSQNVSCIYFQMDLEWKSPLFEFTLSSL